MKRRLLFLLIIAVLLPAVSFAQLGLIGGLNFSKFGGENAAAAADTQIEPDYFIRFAAGIFMIFGPGEGLALRPELVFTSMGAKYEGSYQEVEGKVWAKLSYIQLPVLLQFTIPADDGLALFLLAGPYASYTLSAKERTEIKSLSIDNEIDVKEGIKDLDYGLIVGAGLCLGDMLEVSARYSMGITSFDDTPEIDMKNRVIEFRVGLRLF